MGKPITKLCINIKSNLRSLFLEHVSSSAVAIKMYCLQTSGFAYVNTLDKHKQTTHGNMQEADE